MKQEFSSTPMGSNADFILQLSGLVTETLKMKPVISPDYRNLHAIAPSSQKKGIESVKGEYLDDNTFQLQMLVLSASTDAVVPVSLLIEHLSDLGERIQILPPTEQDALTQSVLRLGMGIDAKPMSHTRYANIVRVLQRIDFFAAELQEMLPEPFTHLNLSELYEDVKSYILPVFPMQTSVLESLPAFWLWLKDTMQFIHSNLSVALVTEHPLTESFLLSAIAAELNEYGRSLGKLAAPSINTKSITEVYERAPGLLVIPSAAIAAGSNVYEIGADIQNLMKLLQAMGGNMLFTGTFQEHQSTFHGGQGGGSSPLLPVIRTFPGAPDTPALVRFAVDDACRKKGNKSRAEKDALTEKMIKDLERIDPAKHIQYIPMLTGRAMNLANKKPLAVEDTGTLTSLVEQASETFSGLNAKPLNGRNKQNQDLLTAKLTDPGLERYLKENLVAQDRAIEQVTGKLYEEVLTRPLHQPLRLCLQGTPATGKSESAVLVAKWLNVPYVNIDAASIPDYYTVSAQLLGSGRGIVGSFKAGRLEETARHHKPVVVEISDLDHAAPNVRSAMADLFLQVMGSGQAQSAVGNMFSCANLILIFTINLPEGKDEQVYKPGIGFNNLPTDKTIRGDVLKEVKLLFSSAFLSRVGMPILFNTLRGEDLLIIAERALSDALVTAADRLGDEIGNIEISQDAAAAVIGQLDQQDSMGARLIQEVARSMVTSAYLAYRNKNEEHKYKQLCVEAEDTDSLTISEKEES
jgi:hypothetical protein